MSRRYRLSPAAAADIEAIAEYYDERSPRYTDRLLRALRNTFRLVGRFPLNGSPADDFLPGLRRKAVDKYLVFFRSTPTGTEIVRVMHGARDIGPDDFAT